MAPLRTLLSAALAAPAIAVVCDGMSSSESPCFDLPGGQKMPQIAMGTWGGSYSDCKSGDSTCAQQHARFAVETWLQLGGTHVDGANDYRTQVSIAEAFRNTPGYARENVFVTTKCPGVMGFEAIMQCADDNLQMLGQFTSHGAGYIDLLLIHFPWVFKPACRFNRADPACKDSAYMPATKEALQDSWRAMEALKKIGVVKSIGLSDYNLTNLQDTVAVATEPIDVHQVEWNPTNHDVDMLSFCQEHGIRLQAWSPLGGTRGSVLSHPVVQGIAKSHNVSTAQVVLKWSLQQGVAVVVGTANPAHAADNLASTKLMLTDDEIKAISALQAPAVEHVVV